MGFLEWSFSGNITQVFLMTLPKLCFTKIAVNKWGYVSEMPPNQPDYPWFLKCILNLGQGKPMLINSAGMPHLPSPPPPSATGLYMSLLVLLDKEFKLDYCFKICLKNCFFLFNENPLKMKKNSFYFILKALFILKIIKLLSWLFGHVEKTAWVEI